MASTQEMQRRAKARRSKDNKYRAIPNRLLNGSKKVDVDLDDDRPYIEQVASRMGIKLV